MYGIFQQDLRWTAPDPRTEAPALASVNEELKAICRTADDALAIAARAKSETALYYVRELTTVELGAILGYLNQRIGVPTIPA